MFKNIIIGVLTLTIFSSMGIAIYEASKVQESSAQVPTAAPTIEQPGGVPVINAQNNMGAAWTGIGIVTSVDEFGFTLQPPDADPIYIELGPPSFWQTQGILQAGESVMVEGFALDQQYHARVVTKADGTAIVTRNESGQPMWSGGAGNAGSGAVGTSEPQVMEWIMLEATITEVGRNGLTVQTQDGQTLTVQTGQPSFAAAQGIVFAVNDAISLTGYWQNGQFMAGQITKTATDESLMLRDPNGRPLWGGPGRGGQGGNGQGNGYRGGH